MCIRIAISCTVTVMQGEYMDLVMLEMSRIVNGHYVESLHETKKTRLLSSSTDQTPCPRYSKSAAPSPTTPASKHSSALCCLAFD